MGREIRKVPRGWQHPKYDKDGRWPGDFRPLFDRDFETAAATWKEGFKAWEDGTHEGRAFMAKVGVPCEFWEYENPPDSETCRPKYESEPICFQIYETVTEGTPVSPVFETLGEMVAWLIGEGHSEHAAREFVRLGWVTSMVMTVPPGGGAPTIAMGIDALDKEGER